MAIAHSQINPFLFVGCWKLWLKYQINLRTGPRLLLKADVVPKCFQPSFWVVLMDGSRNRKRRIDNDSIRCILHVRRRDCVPPPYKHNATAHAKKAPLVWSSSKASRRTYFCPHRLARGEGELEARQQRSRQAWNPFLNRRAWGAPARDVVNSIGEAGPNRPG